MKRLGIGDIRNLMVPAGRFYGPCAGGDLMIAFTLFGDRIDRFIFCDLAYGRPHGTAFAGRDPGTSSERRQRADSPERQSVASRRAAQGARRPRRAKTGEAVPADWKLTSRVSGLDDQQPEKPTWFKSRPVRPFATFEIWRRPDGSEVIVELRRDLAQDVLERCAPQSIAAFIHINDSQGEGGSDLRFLATEHEPTARRDRGERLLQETASRLASGAVVVTDGGELADSDFRLGRPFERAGKRWEPLGTFLSERKQSNGPVFVWRAW